MSMYTIHLHCGSIAMDDLCKCICSKNMYIIVCYMMYRISSGVTIYGKEGGNEKLRPRGGFR